MTREKLMNVDEFQRALGESGFDAVVAVSQPNVFYTSGALITTQTEIRDRLALSVLPTEGDHALLVCNIEESLAKEESWIADVRSYVEFAQSPIHLLVSVLREKGLARGRVGIEKRYLTAAYYEQLVQSLPHARFEACDWLFDQVRAVKSKGEIERFQHAALTTERAIVQALHDAKAGQTERGLIQSVLDKVALLGATDIRFAIVAAGHHSVHAHPKARERQLAPGDPVRVHIGAVFSGYVSDVARTAVVGEPSALQKQAYRNHRQVQRQAIDFMRPGVRARDVFQLCVEAYADLGIEYILPHVGHGLGLGGREPPMLQPYSTWELGANMLICIEPAYLDTDVGGYQLEDLVLIKEGGAELLTTHANTEELFVIQSGGRTTKV